MSIATLKRKTQTQYNNMSVNEIKGFSINGTHRSQGYVGQTMLSRSLPKTLMRGDTERGHGGCCGTYRLTPIVQSAVTSTENPNVVKRSVLGTSGMLATKYRWAKRPAPYTSVKSDNTLNANTQGEYIISLQKQAILVADASNSQSKLLGAVGNSNNYDNYYRTTFCHFSKPDSYFVPISQGELILKINNQCTGNDKIFIPKNTQGTPFLGFNTTY